MATGSGKTLIMAGLILYLYKKGYRNFLFFVHSTNIIEKTKDNFLNPISSKYLFNENIIFDTKRVTVQSVENFESTNEQDINISFTTIQKLHSDLTTIKENALSFQDFKNKKIVLLADEAHHINTKTKQMKLTEQSFERDSRVRGNDRRVGGDKVDATFISDRDPQPSLDRDSSLRGNDHEKGNWENTVEKIFNQNQSNLLLEFTATLDYKHESLAQKYKTKVLYKYDLKHFRDDKYSKDVSIIQADFNQSDRILQALILSQYKQQVAIKYHIPLKPVILFKAQKTIAQNKENKKQFHQMIENLTTQQIMQIKNKSNIPIVQTAFQFFEKNNISGSQLVQRLKLEFQENRCLSVNEEKEKEKNQILLNDLENKNNNIRAIFAVEKLNEGWDVLNLFDIVRCYESRDSGKGKIGKTTMREAQLIGRGARYFPFIIKEDIERAIPNFPIALDNRDDPYKRKFDNNLKHELRTLEELCYHSINDNKYISEIKQALTEVGIMDQKITEKPLNLKEDFKQTAFYKKGLIYKNEKVEANYQNNKSFTDMGVSFKNYTYSISTGKGSKQALFQNNGESAPLSEGQIQDMNLKNIPYHIIQNAIAKNPFFNFDSLRKYYPKEKSIRGFIEKPGFLGGLSVTFEGLSENYSLSNQDKLFAVQGLLTAIENEIKQNTKEYKGTEKFYSHLISKIFKDKKIKISSAQINGDECFVSNKKWYVFKTQLWNL